MAKSMQVISNQLVDGRDKIFAYEYEETLDMAGNGDWVLIPPDVSTVAVTVIPDGTAKIQSTNDNVDTVRDGTPNAEDWLYGDVTEITTGVALPVTAIRLVMISGISAKMLVRAQ